MGRVLIIGAGAAGSVVTQKCARLPHVFTHIHLASRTLDKCLQVQQRCKRPIQVSQCDADEPGQVIACIEESNPDLVINMALPYQDLSIMEACLETGVHYMDTANYEPKDKAEFGYQWQWDYEKRFEEKGILAVLGCGFDPGVTNIFCAYAKKNLLDQVTEIDIIDCNAGDHGHPFATNFNTEINIREITQKGKYYEDGQWLVTEPLSHSQSFEFPEVGKRTAYLMYHEELESLVTHFPELNRIQFWMTFSEDYLTHLKVLQNVGMTSITPLNYQGQSIVPLQFLSTVLPKPSSLGENYKGKTSIGCIVKGSKDGGEKSYLIYNVCEHQDAYADVQSQAVSYTTGVPVVVGAQMILEGKWAGVGVKNVEQFDPDPFLKALPNQGLSWHVKTY